MLLAENVDFGDWLGDNLFYFIFIFLFFNYYWYVSHQVNGRKFEIEDDMFRKDGEPFQIIGGDLHYFRILPQVFLFLLFILLFLKQ